MSCMGKPHRHIYLSLPKFGKGIMGVDHGLGGKDGAKSRQRREKRAKKTKTIAHKAMTGGKKKEVIFNESARVEYLTGFGKRKQERRKYGLAMEVLKKQKAHKEMLKEHRQAFKEKEFKAVDGNEDGDDGDAVNSQVAGEDNGVSSKLYEDPSTLSMFGSTVSVTVDTMIGNASEDDEDINKVGGDRDDSRSTVGSSRPNNRTKIDEPTKLEKALKKAKIMMGKSKNRKSERDDSRHGRARSRALKSQVERSHLLTKALGKPRGGKSKKGNKKKK